MRRVLGEYCLMGSWYVSPFSERKLAHEADKYPNRTSESLKLSQSKP